MRSLNAAQGKAALRLNEEYLCTEGEGATLGAPTWLIRLAGCDLRCWWCDSKHAWDEGGESPLRSVPSMLAACRASGAAWASVSGGEPLWRPKEELGALRLLLQGLKRQGRRVKVETNGRHWRPELDVFVDLWSVSPKWDARGRGVVRAAAMGHHLPSLKAFCQGPGREGRLQLKLVITAGPDGKPLSGDLARARALLVALGPAARKVPVFLISEGLLKGAPYVERCRRLSETVASRAGFWAAWDVRVAPQWQRVLYGNERLK